MSNRSHDKTTSDELRPLRVMLRESGSSELSDEDRVLGQALQALSDEPMPQVPPPSWNALEGQLQGLARRRRWRYHLLEAWRNLGSVRMLATAAAVLLLCGVSALGLRAMSAPTGTESGATLALRRLLRQSPGLTQDHVAIEARTSDSKTTIRCGALLTVASGRIDVDQKEPRRPQIRLHQGRVTVQVPPLGNQGRLTVSTHDAEVIVHGTRFSVVRSDKNDTTEVVVEEGVVEVQPLGGRRGAVFLRAGERVTVPSLSSYLRKLSDDVGSLLEAGRCDATAESTLSEYLTAATPDGEAGHNISAALYQKGSCAAERGEVDSALAYFEQVVKQAGGSLRADNALARSAQLRTDRNKADGIAAWRRYLAQFPSGQHRESAKRFLHDVASAPHEETPH